MMILAVLRGQPRHGYDIAVELERASEGKLVLQQGTLYPMLHKLQKQGYIRGEWDLPEGERARRRYTLTEEGRTELERQIDHWQEYAGAVVRVLQETAE